MAGEEDSSGTAVQRPPPPQQIRVVRCPKCDKLLPELPNYSVYVCGGCGATLQGWCIRPPSPFSSAITPFPTTSLLFYLVFVVVPFSSELYPFHLHFFVALDQQADLMLIINSSATM
jgi:DNA-directed RNA polymerase subunit RPC12/RpoP